jgi:hypothetical protein
MDFHQLFSLNIQSRWKISPLSQLGYRFAPAVVAVFACSPAKPAAVVASDLPPYTPEAAVLFDDSFARDVFDPTLAQHGNDWQRALVLRTRYADAIVRARISTVSRSSAPLDSSESIHELVLNPLEPALAGQTSGEPIAVQLSPQSPAYGLIARGGSSLIGKTVILFFKRYNDEGREAIHWHAETDTDVVKHAIIVAAALGDRESEP